MGNFFWQIREEMALSLVFLGGKVWMRPRFVSETTSPRVGWAIPVSETSSCCAIRFLDMINALGQEEPSRRPRLPICSAAWEIQSP
jgi:hypothetical protein